MSQPTADFDFLAQSTAAAENPRLTKAITTNTLRQYTLRQQIMTQLPDADALRELAGRIKQHTLDHLDFYLKQLCDSVRKNGGTVHFARDGEEARQIIFGILKDANCQKIIKSKSMVSEEIELLHTMESLGMDVAETDLGEFIVQISHDKPSHLVAPIIHKDRASVGELFAQYFGMPYTDDPATLTQQARIYLRDKFRNADFGMTGGNFLIAETGQLCVVENEGNARQSVTTPRVLVSLVGIEKVIPRLTDLSVMLKLLARSSTGQQMTVYTSIFGGPRKSGEKDGPEKFHLVLIDNGRTKLLANKKYRDLLRCIRCGACLNACPVYRKIGGHSYGSVYPGPIGALITPLMQGLEKYKDLPHASSLCGACYEACPVKIDIPRQLVNLRKDILQQKLNGRLERMIYRIWAWGMRSSLRYRLLGALQKFDLRHRANADGWINKLPSAASGWTQVRDIASAGKTHVSTALEGSQLRAAAAKPNDSVDRMLKLVRQALGRDEALTAAPTPPEISESITRIVPADATLVDRFMASAINAKLHVEKVPSSLLAVRVSEFLASKNCRKVGIADTDYLAELMLGGALSQSGLEIHNWAQLSLDASYDLDAGITELYAGIAETGSLVIRPEARCGQALSLIPPIHIAIVRPGNILPDLFDLFAKLSTEPRLPNTTLITGPSKTADIEGALVVGVHGPGYVQVYLTFDQEQPAVRA